MGDACETRSKEDTITTSKVDEKDTMIDGYDEREKRREEARVWSA